MQRQRVKGSSFICTYLIAWPGEAAPRLGNARPEGVLAACAWRRSIARGQPPCAGCAAAPLPPRRARTERCRAPGNRAPPRQSRLDPATHPAQPHAGRLPTPVRPGQPHRPRVAGASRCPPPPAGRYSRRPRSGARA
eukprot:scaffold6024_cov101-Isochrysis_galbana.AAC.2